MSTHQQRNVQDVGLPAGPVDMSSTSMGDTLSRLTANSKLVLGSITEGEPGGVSRNDKAGWTAPAFRSAPVSATPDALLDAMHLPLSRLATGQCALALLDEVMTRIEAHLAAGRQRQRGARQRATIRRAVGAIIGGVLLRWASDTPALAFRSRAKDAFTGEAVSFPSFNAGTRALIRASLIHHAPGISFTADGFEPGSKVSARRAGRYWPSDALLRLAEAHGLAPGNLREEFAWSPSATPPVVRAPAVLRPLEAIGARSRRGRRPTGAGLATMAGAKAPVAILADIEAHNALASAWSVTGCRPPRWRRVFVGDWSLHGRWYALGGEPYLLMPEAERVGLIRMNGEPVAEIDIKASHLSILSALAGCPLDAERDPYEVPGVPRAVVKRWIVAALGKGSPVTRVPRGALDVFAGQDMRALRTAVEARHPILANPKAVVPAALVVQNGDASRVLPHYLAGIEAEALTCAMRGLREGHGVLSLPVHDALIVPRSAVGVAEAALRRAFEAAAGFTPGLDVTRSD